MNENDSQLPNLKTHTERLEWARSRRFKSPREAARELGWNENTYKSHENGVRSKDGLRLDDAKKYARAFSVPVEWLMMVDNGASYPEKIIEERLVTQKSFDKAINDDGSVHVPQLDVRFGMGGGAHYDDAVQATPMSFTRQWLSQITTAKPENLFWASGFGDSMFPTISDRDLVLVDASQREPRIRDQIWALNQYGQGMIKRLRSTATGYEILSDNPQVPPETAVDGSMEVVGRVVAIIRRI